MTESRKNTGIDPQRRTEADAKKLGLLRFELEMTLKTTIKEFSIVGVTTMGAYRAR